jgi:hypothetical protein
MNSDFKSLEEVLNSSPELLHIKRLVDEHNVEKDFFVIFPELKPLIKSVKFTKNILKMSVEIPSLRNELKFRESEIIEKINNFYKSDKVKKIQFSNK